jgi:hypothetical protein
LIALQAVAVAVLAWREQRLLRASFQARTA